MSYDLAICGDSSFSARLPREHVSREVAKLPHIVENGPSGFAFVRGDDAWMEIDLELVDEDGDVEADYGDGVSADVNCINCHVPYAFVDEVDSCIEVARTIAAALNWKGR